MDKILLVKSILEGYEFSHTIVSVSNKVSRERNAERGRPLQESARIRKWLDAESITAGLENAWQRPLLEHGLLVALNHE
jgi:hypothetical protein